MEQLRFSTHASVRSQQRGIPPLVVDLIVRFGRVRHEGDERVFFLDKKGKRQAAGYTGGLLRKDDGKLDAFVVTDTADQVITVGHLYQKKMRRQ
ncbi:hypothetical protein H0Z60_14545 [Ectothiorhodospiraceae bacterium WFHF3C12]|nr:hypothetical protein [Ectothiorhodospiraceae bacterium WFHF3C12]